MTPPVVDVRILPADLPLVREHAVEVDMAPPAAGPEVQVTFAGTTEQQVLWWLQGEHVEVLAIRTRGWS